MERKKIEDLDLTESKQAIADLKFIKKAQQIKIASAKNDKKLKSTEKRLLMEKKTKRLKVIQSEINSASTKAQKDLKRKNKIREANSFDLQISAKNKQIDTIEQKIGAIEKDIKQIEFNIITIQNHIERL